MQRLRVGALPAVSNRIMKNTVVHVIDRLPPDGAERLIAEVIKNRCNALNYRVLCLVEGGELVAEIEAAGVPVDILGKKGKIDLSLIPRIKAYLDTHQAAVVHTHLFTADMWARIAAKWASVPCIVSTAHSVNSWKGPVHKVIDWLLAVTTDRVIACSATVETSLRDQRIPAKKILTVANGIDLARIANEPAVDLSAHRLKPDAPIYCVVGRLNEAKGHSDLLKALAIYRDEGEDFSCVFVGEGELQGDIEAQIAQLDLADRVKLLGWHPSAIGFIKSADVLLMPSRWEGLPMTLLESMAAGTPVIATAVGGIPDVVTHARTGMLYPVGDEQALVAALRRLQFEPGLASAIAEAAELHAKQNYSAEKVARDYEALYAQTASLPDLTIQTQSAANDALAQHVDNHHA